MLMFIILSMEKNKKKKKLNRHIGWAAMYDEYTYQYLFTGL